jgi:hypothetical protein
MVESFPPAVPAAASAEPLSARRVPLWAAVLLTLGAAAIAALGTRAWLLRDFPPSQAAIHGMLADEQVPIELAPTAAGTPSKQALEHPPSMLYGMLPLHSGHGLRDAQCRQLASDAMKEAGITEIDAGGESTLFARQGDYALFVGCHLDQKLILVGAAGPVPEQAESLQEQLLRSLQTRF